VGACFGKTGNAPAADEMSFPAHLAELRRRMLKALAGTIPACVVTWNFAEQILGFLLQPVLKVLPAGRRLIYTGLEDAFLLTLKTSLWAGALLAAPWWMYQTWAFVAPALHPTEKKAVPALAALGTLLLIAGAAFAYFLAFPLTFKFFLAFTTEAMQPLPAVDRYCSLAMGLILAFALAFQLPLVLMLLGRLGLIDAEGLRRHRRYAILTSFILGAILTPPDAISQIALASALLVLYELSIILINRRPKGGSPDREGPQ
jgi:sec-independent protein translocase protein TatC